MNEMMSKLLKLCYLILTMTTANASALEPERPKNPLFTRLYVGASGALVAELLAEGFYRSVDGGARWSRVPPPTDFLKLVSSGLDAERQVCKPQNSGRARPCSGCQGACVQWTVLAPCTGVLAIQSSLAVTAEISGKKPRCGPTRQPPLIIAQASPCKARPSMRSAEACTKAGTVAHIGGQLTRTGRSGRFFRMSQTI